MKLRTEAPVNGGRNYNGPKVRFASLSKIWLYAGRSEYPTLRELLRQLSKSRDNALGADNQQERSVGGGSPRNALENSAREARGSWKGTASVVP